MKSNNQFAWIALAFLSVLIGLYPLVYLIEGREFGILPSKDEALLSNVFWNIGFYGHIIFGGIALLIGWIQFSKKIRNANLKRHRVIGKIYILAALISGICALYIAFYANGGLVSALGFGCLGLLWLFTTVRAYSAIKNRDIQLHQGFMVYSYAACFAAVTLRIWLPLLALIFEDFITAYRIVAWLCWVPNMIFAYFWVRRRGLLLG
ncbi:MAG: DUF2306 domain-containing protein [Flavobacteriaceae bacterium]